VVVTVTHRDERRFPNIDTDGCPFFVGHLGTALCVAGCGDVKIPRSVPLE